MAEVIRMPRMSDTMEEGVIVEWLKKVGDKIEPGDILAEVETDKATMELESYQEGTLLYIGVKKGPVPVNGILAVIGEEGEEYESLLEAESDAAEDTNGSDKPDTQPLSEPNKKTSPAEVKPDRAIMEEEDSSPDGARIKASPLARKMAKESGIELTSVKGSGEGGRIIKADIEKMVEQGPATLTGVAPQVFSEGQSWEVPVSQMRKTIARRLSESKFTAPHYYITLEVNADNLIESRKRINEDAPPKISLNDFIVKAVAMTLRKHPAVNTSWLGDKIKFHADIHIGVAVAVDDGLVVPVLRFADQKSLSQINSEIKNLADRARERKLNPEEMQGNTFTVSNLGMFDVEEFTAIINPPDSCILAVGTIIQKPVVSDGEIKIGNRIRMNLSCDHRAVDGATGAQFLQTLKKYLEDPVRLLI